MTIKRIALFCSSLLTANYALADGDYISVNNYIMNPYMGQTSGGGTQVVQESQIANDNFFQKWFGDGTYNINGAATYGSINHSNNFGYGANIFAQTGSAAGFSIGGNLAIVNPFFASTINPDTGNPSSFEFLPTNRVIFPNEAFVEYKIPNLFQVDAGWLYINTPWLTSFDPISLIQPTFQGILTNFQVSDNILITALATNGYMPISSTGFSGVTLYNANYDFGTSTPNLVNNASSNAYAIGVQYGANSNWKAELWGYQFAGYANMLYGDTSYKLNINKDTNITFSGQLGTEGSKLSPNNAFTNSGYGTPQSNLAGFKVDFNYHIFEIVAAYNNVFGNSSAYSNGGLVSPYTYQLATDPLYTTSTMAGLVEKSAGQAYKISPALNLFDGQFIISPSYAQYLTSAVPNSQEYDLALTYTPKTPGIKGLSFDLYYGYLQQANPSGGNANVQFTQAYVAYLY